MVVNFFFSIDSSLTWRNRKVPRGGDDRCASRMTMSLPPQRGGVFLLHLMLGMTRTWHDEEWCNKGELEFLSLAEERLPLGQVVSLGSAEHALYVALNAYCFCKIASSLCSSPCISFLCCQFLPCIPLLYSQLLLCNFFLPLFY
jgi:hypothetical protein